MTPFLSCIVRANDSLDKMRPQVVGLPVVSSRLPAHLSLLLSSYL